MLSIDTTSKPAMKRIAVFVGKSLLAQGALSYFKQHPENDVEVRSLDVFNPKDALKELESYKPDIVIVETQYLLMDSSFSQSSILELFPDLIMLELCVDSPDVKVIRSERRRPSSFQDLDSSLGISASEPAAPVTPAKQVYSHV